MTYQVSSKNVLGPPSYGSNDDLFAGSRILIVNGDEEAAATLATLLRLSNPVVTTMCAHTAYAAVRLASAYRPNVLIIDAGTQAMSGEVIAGDVLSSCAGFKPLMIALADSESKEPQSRLKQVFDYILTKPIKFSNLNELISHSPFPKQTKN